MDVFRNLGRTEEACLRAVIKYVDKFKKDAATVNWIREYLETATPWEKEFPGTKLRKTLEALHRKHLITQSLRLNENHRYELQLGVTQRGRTAIDRLNNLNEAFR